MKFYFVSAEGCAMRPKKKRRAAPRPTLVEQVEVDTGKDNKAAQHRRRHARRQRPAKAGLKEEG